MASMREIVNTWWQKRKMRRRWKQNSAYLLSELGTIDLATLIHRKPNHDYSVLAREELTLELLEGTMDLWRVGRLLRLKPKELQKDLKELKKVLEFQK